MYTITERPVGADGSEIEYTVIEGLQTYKVRRSNIHRELIELIFNVKENSGGSSWKSPVRALADAAITLTGLQTIDGVVLAAGDRVLTTLQGGVPANVNNGIWLVQSGAWIRPPDADDGSLLVPSTTLWVEEGTLYKETQWTMINDAPIIIGTTALQWLQTGPSTMSAASFVIGETPGGPVDGFNAAFTLANIPVLNKESVYRDGWRVQRGAGNDYTIAGNIITFATPPIVGTKLLADYIK